jgi:hypothetical protein
MWQAEGAEREGEVKGITGNSKLKTQNLKLKTQNSPLPGVKEGIRMGHSVVSRTAEEAH